MQVLRGGLLVVPYYSVGFAVMLVFIALTVSAGAVYHGALSFACVTITLAAVRFIFCCLNFNIKLSVLNTFDIALFI